MGVGRKAMVLEALAQRAVLRQGFSREELASAERSRDEDRFRKGGYKFKGKTTKRRDREWDG